MKNGRRASEPARLLCWGAGQTVQLSRRREKDPAKYRPQMRRQDPRHLLLSPTLTHTPKLWIRREHAWAASHRLLRWLPLLLLRKVYRYHHGIISYYADICAMPSQSAPLVAFAEIHSPRDQCRWRPPTSTRPWLTCRPSAASRVWIILPSVWPFDLKFGRTIFTPDQHIIALRRYQIHLHLSEGYRSPIYHRHAPRERHSLSRKLWPPSRMWCRNWISYTWPVCRRNVSSTRKLRPPERFLCTDPEKWNWQADMLITIPSQSQWDLREESMTIPVPPYFKAGTVRCLCPYGSVWLLTGSGIIFRHLTANYLMNSYIKVNIRSTLCLQNEITMLNARKNRRGFVSIISKPEKSPRSIGTFSWIS